MSIPAISVSSTSENVAAGPRRSGRERNSTQRYESTAQLAGHASSSSLKRKRTNIFEDNNDKLKCALKTHAQAAATTNDSKRSRKRVTTKKTTQSDDASANLSTKSRLNSPSQAAQDVVDLTGDDDAAVTSSKKHRKHKTDKDEEKRLKR